MDILAKAKESTVAKCLKHMNHNNNKAGFIRRTAVLIRDHYGGRVPSDMVQLRALPGVGHKVMHVILHEAFDKVLVRAESCW
jgi:endonuclease-3